MKKNRIDISIIITLIIVIILTLNVSAKTPDQLTNAETLWVASWDGNLYNLYHTILSDIFYYFLPFSY